jgi:hypothetical protein
MGYRDQVPSNPMPQPLASPTSKSLRMSLPCHPNLSLRAAARIRREQVKVLFLDSITDPRAIERIKETGAVIDGTIYSDAVAQPDGPAGTYIDMIHHDIATLKAGMLLN